MKPFLFSIGDVQVSSYYLLLTIGALGCAYYCYWIGGRVGLRREIFLDAGIVGIIAAFVGARLFHVLVEAPGYYWEDPMRIVDIGRGGSVSFGAYLGGSLGIFAYLRFRKLSILRYGDVAALGIPIVQFFGRFSCIMAGCCYGKPTSLPWGITFTNPGTAAYHTFGAIPLHPSQIYEMIQAILVFTAINLFYFKKKSRYPGQTMALLFIMYLIPRGVLEFWRGDVDRGFWFDGLVSTGQIMSVIGTTFCIAWYFYLKRRALRVQKT